MIRRDAANPDFDANNFDFFSDYVDTICWLESQENYKASERLSEAYRRKFFKAKESAANDKH